MHTELVLKVTSVRWSFGCNSHLSPKKHSAGRMNPHDSHQVDRARIRTERKIMTWLPPWPPLSPHYCCSFHPKSPRLPSPWTLPVARFWTPGAGMFAVAWKPVAPGHNDYHSMKLNSRNCHDTSGSSCNPITNCIYIVSTCQSRKPLAYFDLSRLSASLRTDFFFPQVRLTLATQVKQRRLPMFGVHINSQDPKWQWPRHWKAWTPIHLRPAKWPSLNQICSTNWLLLSL